MGGTKPKLLGGQETVRLKRAEGPQIIGAATAKPGQEDLGGITKKQRKTGVGGAERTQASGGASESGR